jgi:UvrD-like helicase C-terminal domain
VHSYAPVLPATVAGIQTYLGSGLMLQRNLLYTGVTRARKLVVLAGSRRAPAAAIRTRGAARRPRLRPAPTTPARALNG